jgi:hypothetical protein
MSSTLLFCDHTCHGLRTLYDCCHVGTIAAMLLESRFVRRRLYALLIVLQGLSIACSAGCVAWQSTYFSVFYSKPDFVACGGH